MGHRRFVVLDLRLFGFGGVVAGAVAGFEGWAGAAGELHFDAAVLGVGVTLRGVVGEQVLGAKLVADLAEGVVELGNGGGVKVFAAGIGGDLDEGVFAAGIASGAGFDGDDDDAVDDGFGLLGGAQGFLVRELADGVSAVGDDDHDLASLAALEGLGAEVEGVIDGGGGAVADVVDGAI